MGTRRPQVQVEQAPHHVYKHFNTNEDLIYVGMTLDPEKRPTDTKQRPWIKTESARVEVSPAMPYDAAAWVERTLIRETKPKHNVNCGNPFVEARDWRIDRIVAVENVTVATAAYFVRYFPEDVDEFEALLERRRVTHAALARGEVPPPDDFTDLFGPVA